MAKKNVDLLNQITATSSPQFQDMVGYAETMSDMERIYETITGYPTIKNEFINALTNKVVKTAFYSKNYSNPLKMLHKGNMRYGSALEQLYVERAERKNFEEHFTGSTTDEGDLIKKQEAKVKARYIAKNYAYKYKVSISDTQLRTAFFSETGLSELVSQLVMSLTRGAEQDEFNDMKKIIKNLVEAGQDFKGNSLNKQVSDVELKAPFIAEVDFSNPKNLVKAFRSTAGRLSFLSDKYNIAGVDQFSDKTELVILTTPENSAEIDVEVIAQAFNVSSVEANIRIIEIDELPTAVCTEIGTKGADKEVLAVMFEKDLLQTVDTVLETRSFENGDKMMTNIFLHKQGIMESCLFCNLVVFTKK